MEENHIVRDAFLDGFGMLSDPHIQSVQVCEQ